MLLSRQSLERGAACADVAVPGDGPTSLHYREEANGKPIAISASSSLSSQSQVYVANADGSNARLVVSAAPSYFHGWSPDGRILSSVSPSKAAKKSDLLRVWLRQRSGLLARREVDL